ncbi:MAG: hypothetical protein ACOCVM_08990 [Desulfovibrionaceae bacterium]
MTRHRFFPIFVAGLLLLLAAGCQDPARDAAGTYVAPHVVDSGEVKLALQADRSGWWKVRNETQRFAWRMANGGVVWLETAIGSRYAGRLSGESLGIDLPGHGTYELKKTGSNPG